MFRINSRVYGELSGVLQDNITGMKEIKAFGCEESEHNKMKHNCHYYAKVNIRANLANAVFTPGIELVTSIGTILVLLFGGMLVLDGKMRISDIVGFIMYLSLFYTPLAVLARLVEDMQAAAASAQRVFELLDSTPEIPEAPDAKPLEALVPDQSDLAAQLQVAGIIIERDSVSRIEIGTRFVADYELRELARILKVTVPWLLGME